MCIGLPCKIIALEGPEQALVELGDIRRSVLLDLVENVKVGDYVIVHAGYAINKVDEEEAEKTLELVRSFEGLGNEIY